MGEIVKFMTHRSLRRDTGEREIVREFLGVMLAGQAYGVELTRIREILSPPPLTPVPRAPQHVKGVCSVRGQLVTVIDLRSRLRLEEAIPTRKTRILLTENSGEVVGLYVDEVRHVLRLTEAEIEPATAVFGNELSEHVIGIGRPPGHVLVLLDLNSVVPR
jgi:purine-binding chemotaxis protein CheW